MSKPVILLCWGYNRLSWVQFFEPLSDYFEFVYLFYLDPSEEQGQPVYTSNRRIYYKDFKSASELLSQIKPSKVIFMGLDGLLAIAVNIECRKKAVPAYLMNHGISALNVKDIETVVYEKRQVFKEAFSKKIFNWIFTFRFLIHALGFRYISYLPAFLKFQMNRLKVHPAVALKKCNLSLRKPDKYIIFAKAGTAYYVDVDDAKMEDFIILGNLEITSYIKYADKFAVKDGGYLLYIETPISVIENSEFSNLIITKEENSALINGLNDFAMSNGLKLFVKLHPYTYANTYYPIHDNIRYYKDCDKEELILNASGVIFYNSSLSIPALLFKNCCMFTIGKPDNFQKGIAETGICAVIDYKEILLKHNIQMFDFSPTEEARQKFIDAYIGTNTDGEGLMRLKDILEN